MKNPIILKQIYVDGGIDTKLSTSPKISNKELRDFFNDLSEILKELDQEINSESKFFTWWNFFPPKYSRLEKCLHVRKNDIPIRFHNLIYHRKAQELSDDLKEVIKDNMFKHTLIVKNNVDIHSSGAYNPNDLVKRIGDLHYIRMPDGFEIYNPKQMIDFLSAEVKGNYLI